MADQLHIDDLEMNDHRKLVQINKILKKLDLDDDRMLRVGTVFCHEMDAALAEKPSSLQMENTYIPELPDGSEDGIYLALDLGGTNFRAILLELRSGVIVREEVKRYDIADDQRTGCGLQLFDYLAACLVDFVVEQGLEDVPLPLGFTFSFPMRQHSLDSGVLVTWTKSFNCRDVVGEDVVRMLRDALSRCGHNHIDVLAILNDTTGTVLQGARIDPQTRIGIVVGTGSNACYVERADRVQHWETERHGEKMVIIDIEWGAFGDNGCLDFMRTEFDIELDERSLLVNSFTFEKYIGGKYLGELVRCVLYRLYNEGLFLRKSIGTDRFPEPWSFNSDQISEIELDIVESTSQRTINILTQLGYAADTDFSSDDIAIAKHVAAIVGWRAAKLVSICTAAILRRMTDDESVTIAIDGSVYKHHPRLKGWLAQFIGQLAPEKRFQLMLAEDGSGKGAGLAAAIAWRLKNRTQKI